MTPEQIADALAAPFESREVKWKPQSVKGTRALAIAYIDARLVMDRLDDVFGPGGWQDEYTPLPNGSVLCRLSAKIGGEWVAKTDVGGESEQPDEGDRTKAAFSDALKRAAVKFGVGRYIYRLPHQWADYDPQKKRFVGTPSLPAWAVPKAATKPAPAPYKAPAEDADDPVELTPAKPSPAPGKAQPAESLADAVQATLKVAKKGWADVLAWVNESFKTGHPAKTKFGDIDPAHLQAWVDAFTPQ